MSAHKSARGIIFKLSTPFDYQKHVSDDWETGDKLFMAGFGFPNKNDFVTIRLTDEYYCENFFALTNPKIREMIDEGKERLSEFSEIIDVDYSVQPIPFSINYYNGVDFPLDLVEDWGDLIRRIKEIELSGD